MSERVNKRVQIIVVSAVTLLFTLICVLTFQIAINLNRNSQLNQLLAEQARLETQLRNAENAQYLMGSEDFIYYFALRELGWGRPGQVIFRR